MPMTQTEFHHATPIYEDLPVWFESISLCVFFFNDTATTEIYTLSLHDALPICPWLVLHVACSHPHAIPRHGPRTDRKSTRLNSSHTLISYAVFCLKKKNIYLGNQLPVGFAQHADDLLVGKASLSHWLLFFF